MILTTLKQNIMASIDNPFKICETVLQLSKCINDNSYLLYSKDITLTLIFLNNCYYNCKKDNCPKIFEIILIESKPFTVKYIIYPDGNITLK